MPDAQPTASISFDPIAHRYDATRYHPADIAQQIAKGLIALGPIPANGSILEIGVGTGRIALPLLAEGVNVTGVDISTKMLDLLHAKLADRQAAEPHRAWGALAVHITDATALPFADHTFDAAVTVHVFHLIPAWRDALSEVFRALKPDAPFLLGQDVRPIDAHERVHERWQEIIDTLGYTPRRVGAEGYSEVVAELRRRGHPVEERTLLTWQESIAPRLALESITRREWSQTWPVPDDLFDASVRQLVAWADAEYGDQLDTPLPVQFGFKVARALNRVHP